MQNLPKTHTLRLWIWLPWLLLALALACSLPSFGGEPESSDQPPAIEVEGPTSTATLPPAPTPTPRPLPPALVEVEPAPGSTLPIQGGWTLYFNQAMERDSVEAALSGQPALSGRFNWRDDATVEFQPDAAFLPGSELHLTISTAARAANSLTMLAPFELTYQIAGPMHAIQLLPAPGSELIDPRAALMVVFDQPVVPLGADPAGLPVAFSLEPASSGRGEWINTSTYIFYPEPALVGGQTQIVRLNPELRSLSGSRLAGRLDFADSFDWIFVTAPARLESIQPQHNTTDLPLDSTFTLTFTQPMNALSVQQNFNLLDEDAIPVPGDFGWNADGITLTFTPTQLLQRDHSYSLLLSGAAVAQGGNSLGLDYTIQVQTVPDLYLVSSSPAQDGIGQPDRGVTLYFSAPLDPWQADRNLSILPKVPNLSTWWNAYDHSLHLTGDFKALTEYTLVVSGGMPDAWDGNLGQEYILRFSTGPFDPNLVLAAAANDLFVLPAEINLPVQATNLGLVDLSLGAVPLADLARFLGPDGYQVRSSYVPADVRSWQVSLDLPGDQLYDIELPLTPDGGPLAPGIYLLRINAPSLAYAPSPYLLVSSQRHLTLKVSPTQVFVWAVDLVNDTRVANAPVRVYGPQGELLAEGLTDRDGIFQQAIDPLEDVYGTFYALSGSPGEPDFALSISSWNSGLQSHEFGLPADYSLPGFTVYLYTDRPIYRPGQTVYFRAIVRQEEEARYRLPDWQVLPLSIMDGNYDVLTELELPLSAFGTASAAYQIPADAQPVILVSRR